MGWIARLLAVVLALVGLQAAGIASSAADCSVTGAIGAHWNALGGVGSPVGACTGNARPVVGGWSQDFDRGTITWTVQTGAQAVYGPTWTAWVAQGRENSGLGFPTSDTAVIPGGTRSTFEGGYVSSVGGGLDRRSARPAFSYRIDPVDATYLGSSYRVGCPVGPSDLRRLTITYYGFDGGTHEGELVVHADAVQAFLGAFRSLYVQRFPIASLQPVTAYGSSDDASMAANNTSAFNCRNVSGTSTWSQHSYGRAVDVNPLQNPYVRGGTVSPPAGAAYAWDRSARPGVITAGGPVVAAFAAEGLSWGGDWTSSKDYQHFSTNGR